MRLFILGYVDGYYEVVRFNDLQGCTQFGSQIAVADRGNGAIRLIDIESNMTSTLIKAPGSQDGIFDNTSSSVGQIEGVYHIEALDSERLLVASDSSTSIRLINTATQHITTLNSNPLYGVNKVKEISYCCF